MKEKEIGKLRNIFPNLFAVLFAGMFSVALDFGHMAFTLDSPGFVLLCRII